MLVLHPLTLVNFVEHTPALTLISSAYTSCILIEENRAQGVKVRSHFF